MAPGWEMGMDFGMHLDAPGGAAAAAASPASYMYGVPLAETLRVDDLLDFSNHDLFPSSATDPTSTSSAAAASHFLAPPPAPPASFAAATFSDDLYIPCEEAAELEWLSQFVDDSFSDFPYPTGGGGVAAAAAAPAAAAPGRGARSKRSKGVGSHHRPHPSANIWSSSASTTSSSSSSSSEFPSSAKPRKGEAEGAGAGAGTAARRCCTHCASEKTPQWRTGPLGPKTLCNACGVRFKSGRLVPEYRPAASPTFVLTQHSNSHRKVLELRRQKEMLGHISSSSGAAAGAALPELLFHDYEVC